MVKLTPKKTVSRRKKLVLVAVTMGAGLIAATVAVPRLMQPAEDEFPPAATVVPSKPAKPQAAEPVGATPDDAETAEPTPEIHPVVATVPDGDLSVALALDSDTFEHGTPVTAHMTLVNHDDEAFHLPAPTEPQAHVELVVVDATGNEVRRVAEQTDEPLPRRTLRIDPGHRTHMDLHVVAEGEEPLPPGRYAVHVEVTASPHWHRTGLRTWDAPNGRLRSPAVLLDVVAPE